MKTIVGKKIAALFITVAMLTAALAGCSKSGDSSGASGGTKEEAQGKGDMYTVTVYAPYAATTEDCDAIAAKISEITEKEIGCKVELVRNVTKEQLNLALTSGEKLDLFYAFPWEVSLSSMASSNQIVAMDDLLKQYGSDMQNSISADDFKCVTVGGKVYGIPMNKDKAQARGFLMDKAIADEVGIDYTVKKTYAELEADLQKVKDAHPDIWPVVANAGTMMRPLPVDTLGDNLGVLENALGDSTQVVNLYDSNSYKEYVGYMYKWAQNGLMMPDAANTTESYDALIRSGVGFGTFTPIKAGFEAEETRKCGKDIVAVTMYDAHSITTMVNAAWCIANNSKNPDKAMQMLNLMYTNPEVANLFANGIEGKNYKYVDKEKNIITYADGIDASNTGYSVVGWAWPNEQITSVWQGDDADVWTKLGEFNKAAKSSPAKGFVWDNSKVLNEVTASQNVISKYEASLDCGSVNPDEALPKMNEELKSAGLDKIIKEKQQQLDAWLAANK